MSPDASIEEGSASAAAREAQAQRVLWLVRSGESGEWVDHCVANRVAAVGYPTVGDVRERSFTQIIDELQLARNRSDYETLAHRLLDFARRMRHGDFVVTSDAARRQLVVGRVSGAYEWREDSPIPGMRHLLPVEWLGRIDWDDLDERATRSLVKYPRTILEITDPELVALGERAESGDLLSATPQPRARRPGGRQTASASRSDERLCRGCFLWKNLSQFDGDATMCREHTG